MHGVHFFLELLRPHNIFAVRSLKKLDGAADEDVEIAFDLGLLVFLVEAEAGQIVSNFGSPFGSLFNFTEGEAPFMVLLHLPKDVGAVTEDGGQSIVEVQCHRARELHRTIEFLLLCGVRFDGGAFVVRGFARAICRQHRHWIQLKEEIRLSAQIERRDRGIESRNIAVASAEFQGHDRRGKVIA